MNKPDISTNAHVQIDLSINLCVLRYAFLELFCIFVDVYASGTLYAEVTKLLYKGEINTCMISFG